MGKNVDDLAKACFLLTERFEKLSKEVVALTNLTALLVRELALSKSDPLDYFAKLEAEVGGLGEAIAVNTQNIEDVTVSSREITALFEAVLRQARNSLESHQT